MTLQQLIAKRALLEAKKVELSLQTFEDEIEAEVSKFRAELEKKYSEQKLEDEQKIDHYLEFVNTLISEETAIANEQDDYTQDNDVEQSVESATT